MIEKRGPVADLALARWNEVRQIKDPEIRTGLLQRIARTMAGMYAAEVRGETAEERMAAVGRLLGERNVPFTVDRSGQLPVLTALASRACGAGGYSLPRSG